MAKSSESTPGDPLKYYCIVFGVLIVVIGIMYFLQRSTLEAYRVENEKAERLLTADANALDSQNRPRQLAALGLATHRLVTGYAAAVGGEGETRGISSEKIEALAATALVEYDRANSETIDPYGTRGFEQVQREYSFKPTDLANFTRLLYNIEGGTRYRVFEMNWRMRPTRENVDPPHHLITGPTIKVGFRRPLATSGN